jgi:hypothetical protein
MATITITVPIRTQSEPNMRGMGFFGKAKRAKDQRLAVWAAMLETRGILGELKSWSRWHVRLKRVSPNELDTDNLPAALKAVRDQVAHSLGVGRTGKDGKFREDDNDPRFAWSYAQGKCQRGNFEVQIRFSQEPLP